MKYDELGVPHIYAQNELDLYRALGYVQAQDRLFQMEMWRRLAEGDLSSIVGPKALDVDIFFRTLGLKKTAEKMAIELQSQPKLEAIGQAYLGGVNEYVNTRPDPLEFDILGIKKRDFTMVDVFAIAGYMAYSFDPAFKLIPALTYINKKLGANYLEPFNYVWKKPVNYAKKEVAVASNSLAQKLGAINWDDLKTITTAQNQITSVSGVPVIAGSNAWAVSGKLTKSGKPILSGDPHINYSVPAVWYEADLHSPDFNLYGFFLPLVPVALLGHNDQFAWSITMLMNSDTNFVSLQANPQNLSEVKYKNTWVPLEKRKEIINIKGEKPLNLTVESSPYGPIINQVIKGGKYTSPIAMRWTYEQVNNPIFQGFYLLDRANTLEKAHEAASMVAAPGLNLVWANAKGDIAWWAMAKVSHYPAGVNPFLIMDSSQADKSTYRPFTQNPGEVNPNRGFIASANNQAISPFPIVGSYVLDYRFNEITRQLEKSEQKPMTVDDMKKIQLDINTQMGPDFIGSISADLNQVVTDPKQKELLKRLEKWDGKYALNSICATVFNQLYYEVARVLIEPKVGKVFFEALNGSRPMQVAILKIAKDPNSIWWQQKGKSNHDARLDSLKKAWDDSLAHLTKLYGKDYGRWIWGRAHQLLQSHPLGMVKPLNYLFNVGPYPIDGGMETPNDTGYSIGPAPWYASFGPSTRRIIDFGDPSHAVGILPVGESGVPFDAHYQDQVADYVAGRYHTMWTNEADVKDHTASTLVLRPEKVTKGIH